MSVEHFPERAGTIRSLWPSAALDNLPAIEIVDTLPVKALPAVLLHLSAMQTRVAARLVRTPLSAPSEPAAPREVSITVQDAAARTGLPATWIMRAARQGRIRSRKLGRWRVFDPVELAEDVKGLQASPRQTIQRVCQARSFGGSALDSASRKRRSAK